MVTGSSRAALAIFSGLRKPAEAFRFNAPVAPEISFLADLTDFLDLDLFRSRFIVMGSSSIAGIVVSLEIDYELKSYLGFVL
tara:strand:- start:1147 stop:1392 length:246 start_codon:yes stop_codon:yes gene_type:complete